MLVTDLILCDFVLHSPKGSPSIQRLRRDEQSINRQRYNLSALCIKFWHLNTLKCGYASLVICFNFVKSLRPRKCCHCFTFSVLSFARGFFQSVIFVRKSIPIGTAVITYNLAIFSIILQYILCYSLKVYFVRKFTNFTDEYHT